MERKTASDFPQELLDLYDYYAHGLIDRRTFLERASKFATLGLTGTALLSSLSPNYVLAQQVPADDERVESKYVTYSSPEGHGTMKGLLARPSKLKGKVPAVLVVHENRGLNPYIEDVARRVAVAGFVAFAPDALTPLGGYPGNDDEGRAMQRKLDAGKMAESFPLSNLRGEPNVLIFPDLQSGRIASESCGCHPAYRRQLIHGQKSGRPVPSPETRDNRQ